MILKPALFEYNRYSFDYFPAAIFVSPVVLRRVSITLISSRAVCTMWGNAETREGKKNSPARGKIQV